MCDPLDFRDLFVLHGNEPGPVGQDDIAEILESDFFPLEFLEVLPGHVDLRPDRNLSPSSTRKIRMQGSLDPFNRRQPLDFDRDGVGHEEIAIRILVDQLAVLRIERLRRHLDIVQAETEREDEIPQRRGPNPTALEGLERPRSWVVNSREATRLDLLPVSRFREFEIFEPQDAEVDEVRTRGHVEYVPDPGLHRVLHDEVLPSQDVGYAEEMVIDRPGELEHGPDTIAVSNPRVLPLRDAEYDPVAKRGVRVGHVRLEPDDRLSLAVLPREHRLPHRDRLVDVLDAVHARLHRLPILPKRVCIALAHVRLAGPEELLGPFVVQRDAVALVQDLVIFDARPVEARPNLIVRFREDRFLLRSDRIVEHEEEATMIALRVGVVQDEGARVPDVQRTARVRGETKDHVSIRGPRERRQYLRTHVL